MAPLAPAGPAGPVAPALAAEDHTTYLEVPRGQTVDDHANVITRVVLLTHMYRVPSGVPPPAADAGATSAPLELTSAAQNPQATRTRALLC